MRRVKHTFEGKTYHYAGGQVDGAAYHLEDGWFFDRLPDGSVRISKQDNWLGMKEYQVEAKEVLVIPPGPWASIICSVANRQYTGELWNQVCQLHNGN